MFSPCPSPDCYHEEALRRARKFAARGDWDNAVFYANYALHGEHCCPSGCVVKAAAKQLLFNLEAMPLDPSAGLVSTERPGRL